MHDDPTDPAETGASAAELAGANLVTLTATITDGDGDTDIGDARHRRRRLRSRTTGRRSSVGGDGPTLVTDDTDTPNDMAGAVSFAGLFTLGLWRDGFKDADDNDVEDADAISYALGVSAPGGVDSGLVDTLSGDKIYLFLEGGQVVGRVGLDGMAGESGRRGCVHDQR